MNEKNDAHQDQSPEQPGLREISEEELKEILEEHKKWVETEGKEGIQANLHNANLMEANLMEANLGGANLLEADLGGADLRGAILFGADLRGADLGKAMNLTRKQIRTANTDEKTKLPKYLEEPKTKKPGK